MGGIAGRNDSAIQNCVNSGEVKNGPASDGETGGITGANAGTIINCINAGKVNAQDNNRTGGIAGTSSNTITNCGWVSHDGANIQGVGDGSTRGTYNLTAEDAKIAVIALTAKISSNTIAQNENAQITLDTKPGTGTFGAEGAVRSVDLLCSPQGIVSAQNDGNGTITVTGLAEGTAVITVSAMLYATNFSTGGGYIEDNELDYETSFTVTVTGNVEDTPGEGDDTPVPEPEQPASSGGGGGGGCSTGLGALALLAVIPLAIRRNKR